MYVRMKKIAKVQLSLVVPLILLFLYCHYDNHTKLPEPSNDSPPQRKILNINYILPSPDNGEVMTFDYVINVVLGGLDRPIRIINDINHKSNDTIFVYSQNVITEDRVRNLKQDGCVNQGLFHLGDELHSFDISPYKLVDYVFRNYYYEPYLEMRNLTYIPLGTNTGFGSFEQSTMIPASARLYQANFVGSLRSNRMEMINAVKSSTSLSNIYLSYEHAWRHGMDIISYRNIVRDSVFTLCPWGNNPESLRFYEAMEAGSIPIYQSHPDPELEFIKTFGPHNPVPQFQTWNESVQFMNEMINSPRKLDALQGDIIKFWKNQKKKIQLQVKNIIDRAFHESHGYPC
jgi:hypothetical protein